MKIVIPDGTGQVGTILARNFIASGHEVVLLSRRQRQSPFKIVEWDVMTLGDWVDKIDGADVVINLAGRNVNCRYHRSNRRKIIESRVASTHAVGQAIANSARAPSVWLQASTATIYAHRVDSVTGGRSTLEFEFQKRQITRGFPDGESRKPE